jgi:hypothetical protein
MKRRKGMTSINALRFDRYSGICIGDESISTVAEMRVNLGEKVRPCMPEPIFETYGTVAVIGTTGGCAMGGTIQETLENRLRRLFEKEIEKTGKKPEKFLTIEDIARMTFDVVIETKHQRHNEKIRGTYDFNVSEFLKGSYERDGKTYEIKDKEIIREVVDQMVWRNQVEDVGYIFLNAGLLVGYDDKLGFQIYHFDLRDGYWHRVQNCYMAEGSGRHSVDPALYGFAEHWLLEERRGNIDPVEGSIALVHGVNTASDHELGVGGYYNIILIDGRKENFQDRLREINDDRSLLTNHVVRALEHHFISYRDAYEYVKELLFENTPFEEVYEKFWGTVKEPEVMCRLLRRYKIIPAKLH